MESKFKWWYTIFAFIAYLIAIILNSFVAGETQSYFESINFNSGPVFNILMFILAGVLVLILFKFLSKNKLSRLDFGIHTQNFKNAILYGLLLGLVFLGISEFTEYLSPSLKEAGKVAMESFNIGSSLKSDLLLLLNVGLFAPVFEEIVFRGAIFKPLHESLKKYKSIPKWLNLVIAVFISSFLFISIHGGEGQDEQMVLLAILSVFTCLAFYLTNNLMSAIYVHAVNNNLVLILYMTRFGNNTVSYNITFICLSIICLILCYPLARLAGGILAKK